MTAQPLTTTDPRWDDPRTVHAIAAGDDWQKHVAAAAHDLAHPKPVYACPGCPQTVNCPSCDLPAVMCEDPSGHDRVWRAGDTSLLVGGVRQ